jgi:hypothetical protein
MTSITDRRAFLAVSAGAVVACAGMAGASGARVWSTRADPPDPMLAAIALHREAINRLNTAHAKLVAEGLTDSNSQPVGAALMATFAPARALIDTPPTTRAGLQALDAYLREDSIGPRMARQNINYPRTVDGIPFTASDGSPEAVDWFIAKRAAEIDHG